LGADRVDERGELDKERFGGAYPGDAREPRAVCVELLRKEAYYKSTAAKAGIGTRWGKPRRREKFLGKGEALAPKKTFYLVHGETGALKPRKKCGGLRKRMVSRGGLRQGAEA